MARPRVFVSSTHYDLKHIRSSIDLFIESLGYDSILSEKGDIAYSSDIPLDESCYREAQGADIFVLIIGGRYGSEISKSSSKINSRTFFDRYESITKKEYESAVARDIPIYILVENGVYSEYQTYLRNKENKTIVYAHVDSVNIFHLIEEILARPRNNPLKTFERFSDIESWLREQWAGHFRELLNRQSQQQQYMALATQVAGLQEVNETLKKYLEVVMNSVGPADSSEIIASEEKRLQEARLYERLKLNGWINYIDRNFDISIDQFLDIAKSSKSIEEFAELAGKISAVPDTKEDILSTLGIINAAKTDLNEALSLLGRPPLQFESEDSGESSHLRSEKNKRRL